MLCSIVLVVLLLTLSAGATWPGNLGPVAQIAAQGAQRTFFGRVLHRGERRGPRTAAQSQGLPTCKGLLHSDELLHPWHACTVRKQGLGPQTVRGLRQAHES
jgi:hypothetical protein